MSENENIPTININLVGSVVLLEVKSDNQEHDRKVANHFHKMISLMIARYLKRKGCEITITPEE